MVTLKRKKAGLGLEMKTFAGENGDNYLVFRTNKGSFHVFKEVEAKQASRECGCKVEGNTRQMWGSLWARNIE